MSDPKLVIDEGDKTDNETMDIASDNETVGKIVDTVVDDALDKSATKKDNKKSFQTKPKSKNPEKTQTKTSKQQEKELFGSTSDLDETPPRSPDETLLDEDDVNIIKISFLQLLFISF